MIPYTDYECRLLLDELYRGDKVVKPSSLEHANFMIMVAQAYIKESKQNMWASLGGDNGPKC